MEFFERLNALMKEKNVKQAEITRELGYTSGNFAIWRKGSTPRPDAVKKLADFFGVSQSYMLCLTDDPYKDIEDKDNPLVYDYMKARLIPVFSGIPESQNIFEEYKYIDNQVFCSEHLREIPDLFAITATSSTMSPLVQVGDLIIAQYTELCKNGDMCLYRFFGDIGVRWFQETDDYYNLIPENEKNKPIVISKNSMETTDFAIVGKVYEVRKFSRNLYKSELK